MSWPASILFFFLTLIAFPMLLLLAVLGVLALSLACAVLLAVLTAACLRVGEKLTGWLK